METEGEEVMTETEKGAETELEKEGIRGRDGIVHDITKLQL